MEKNLLKKRQCKRWSTKLSFDIKNAPCSSMAVEVNDGQKDSN